MVNDENILKKYVRAQGLEGLKEVLEQLWQETKQGPSFAAREHFVLYQLDSQRSLIKINTEHPFVWYYDALNRPMTNKMKATIAHFLWENAGEKERNSPKSFEEWYEHNEKWMIDLSRNGRGILMDGGVLASFPKDLTASIDAVITSAKLPARALEAKQAHKVEVDVAPIAGPVTAIPAKSGQPAAAPYPWSLTNMGLFAHHKDQAAPKPQVGPIPESSLEKNKAHKR